MIRTNLVLAMLLTCAVVALAPHASATSCDPVGSGPVTLPTLLQVNGVPVVGTLAVGGETLPGESAGPVPTGLDPGSVTVFSQSVPVGVSASCTLQFVHDEEFCARSIEQDP